MITLRKFQREMDALCGRVLEGAPVPRPIVAHVCPGGGKSALPVILGARLHGKVFDRICWVAPRRSLCKQGEREFLKPVWRDGFGHRLELRAAVNEGDPCRDADGYVTTYQAIAADVSATHLREFRRSRYLLVLDEIHHVWSGGDWARAIEPLYEAASMVLAMTGHVTRHDDLPILGLTYRDGYLARDGWIVYSVRDAVAEGAIRKVTFRRHDARTQWKDLESDKTETADTLGSNKKALFTALSTGFAGQLLDQCMADWVRARKAASWPRVLVVCAEQKDARAALRHIREQHPEAHSDIATSADSEKARRNIERLRNGLLDVLVTVAMAYEGLDVPEITHIACITHIRSAPWIEQMIGRAWRRHHRDLPSQRGHIFVPDDDLMRGICEGIEQEQDRTIREQGDQAGETDSQEQQEREDLDRIMPLWSSMTGMGATVMGGRAMDQDLLRRCMAVIEQLGLPVGPETLAEAMDLLARSQQGTAPGRETPPPPTSAEREEALRAEISGHINAWAARHREDHENPFRFANAECLKAGFGQRELLGEAELTRLLLYVRRRFPRS